MAKWDRNSKWQNGIEYFNRKNGGKRNKWQKWDRILKMVMSSKK